MPDQLHQDRRTHSDNYHRRDHQGRRYPI